ncbi:unnamed protein product [Schistosoma turkestanicum]|nr:unnamed protein product [Schistosoma turkestanicum]
MYRFDHNEKEWIEQLKYYPIENQVVEKRRWNQSPWMFENIIQEKINNDIKTDSIDSIIQSINRLDLNVYFIDLFLNHTNYSTIVEFRKCNDNENHRFSKYDRYLLSNYITDFLLIIMPQVHLNNELYIMRNKNELNIELVAYHMKIPPNEIAQLVNHKLENVTELHPNFNEIDFLARSISENDSTVAVMLMFENLGFVQKWQMCQSDLACFILTVKKSYRTPTYHNWTHAFTVGHMAYIALTIERQLINQYLDDLERLALFVGTLCHDLDHRGFNNDYEELIHSPLAEIYGYQGSILEHHHLGQAMRILNSTDCNIFNQMTKVEYERFKSLLKQIIIATDLFQHIALKPDLIQLTSQTFNPMNDKHRQLLLSIIVTACDLNDQCKQWSNTCEVAKLIYHEFFHQGDLELSCHNRNIPLSLDRNKAFIPELQIHFLETIVQPCFKLLSLILPKFQSTLKTIHKNKQIWQMLSNKFKQNELTDYTNELLFEKFYHQLVEEYSIANNL